MSKTFLYALAVIAIYLVVIMPDSSSTTEKSATVKRNNKADTENGTGLAENADENGVSQGASGQLKYRIGYVK